MTIKELTALPKVELHCHLDGSLSHGFIEKRLGRKVSQSELSVSEDCRSLNEYLQKFDLPGKCIMDETGLKEAGYDVLKSMKQENVCYAEIRFAPLLSETPDMNCNKVIEALLAGLEKGKRDFGVEYGVITCAMRHHSEEEMHVCCGLPENIWDMACVRQILPGRKACIRCQNSWNCSKRRKHLACHLPYMPVNAETYRISLILWKPELEESDMELQ